MDAQMITTPALDITDLKGQVSKRSKRIYENDAKAFATWMTEQGLTPASLTRSHMITYRSYLAESYAVATAQRMWSVASRILQEQVYSGSIASNPAHGIKGFKVNNETTHTALTKDQAKDLFASIDTSTQKGKRDYALLAVLLRTGLRRFECSALNIGDIKMEQGHYTATILHGKGDKRDTIKIPVDVFRSIQAYIEATGRQNASPNEPLFVGFNKGDHPTNDRMSDKTIERTVKAYGDKIGVELTPHCLRATFITLALEGNAPLQKVQYAARHADPRTTERYQTRKFNLDDNAVDYIKL